MAHDFNAITLSGNLLTSDFLYSSQQPVNQCDAFDPGSFDPSWKTSKDFEEQLSLAWDDLKERYDAIERELANMDTASVRRQWLLPFLQTLGFSPEFQKAHTRIENVSETFPITYRGWDGEDAPAIHLLSPQDDLDLKPAQRGAKSPQMMVQTYLNQDNTQTWAILSNGWVLRLLRDYYHTSQPGYIEFNLDQLFVTCDFDEFRSLYRLCHASRFIPRGTVLETKTSASDDEGEAYEEEKQPPIWLEVCYDQARTEGSRAEEDLRENVKEALEILGDGLLTPELREELADQNELDAYYRQLLRVIYRCIFLLIAEQRGLVPAQALDRQVYLDEYSLTSLRDLSEEQRYVRDEGYDLWERLLITFNIAREGNEDLGVQAFNGRLFDPSNIDLVTRGCINQKERGSRDELPRLSNEQVLTFIGCLGYTDVNGAKERINYRDLAVEEVGHIYEGLLDYAPDIAIEDVYLEDKLIPAGSFFLRQSMERKSTGSYYTPKELVQEVISRTLLPVIEVRLNEAGNSLEEQEKALLNLRVLDPACGSGAFLIAANDALAQALADLRWQAKQGQDLSNFAFEGRVGIRQRNNTIKKTYQKEVGRAKRDVLANCIYGVDYNDMAVELAQFALWINAAALKPLSFLDHRIKHGNSLIGAPLNFVHLGINPDAYKGRGDADKETLKEIRKILSPRAYKDRLKKLDENEQLFDLPLNVPDLNAIKEEDRDDVTEKKRVYRSFTEQDAFKKWQFVADYWTSAFFYPVKPGVGRIPNQRDLNYLLQSINEQSYKQLISQRITPQETGRIDALKHQYGFFHYWLEYPEVFFKSNGDLKEGGGFDVIVGNPPWERVKLQEKEFFATRDEEIAEAPNAAKRKKLIKALETNNPDFYQTFQEALVKADATSNFLRVSGRYPLGGVGDVNTYQVFTENARDLTGKAGQTGIIVPSGIATDNTTKDLFRDFVESKSLVSLDDFENREKIFQAVDSRMKFCLLTLTAPGSGPEEAQFSFFNTNTSHLNDLSRHFTLSFEDFEAINPNTLTCPTFRTGKDAEITLKMYGRAGVFIDENDKENGNPWGASFMRMFDMSNDSSKFRTAEELEGRGLTLSGNRFVGEGEVYLPLYEAKLMHQFNHRFATYIDNSNTKYFNEELNKSVSIIQAKYWVSEAEVDKKLDFKYSLAYRDICRSNDERTGICSYIPRSAVSGGSPLMLTKKSKLLESAFYANVNALIADYVTRQKITGAHLKYFHFKQLPILVPNFYNELQLRDISVRVLELTYTAWDIKAFADDLWREAGQDMRALFREQWQANAEASGGGHAFDPPEWADIDAGGCPLAPFTWNEERRAELRAELDALYAYFYGLTRDELLWILDPRDVDPSTPSVTFPGLRRNEEKKFGEYRTKRLVLHYYDALMEQFADRRVSDDFVLSEDSGLEVRVTDDFSENDFLDTQVPTVK